MKLKKQDLMGKMKELFIELQEQEPQNIPVEEPVYATDVPCPNCLKSNLTQISAVDYVCDKCGYDFIEVSKNRFRFR
jgi:predicted RNA-binding Zn-ribbon protein involved in translation (DUF1610 family)